MRKFCLSVVVVLSFVTLSGNAHAQDGSSLPGYDDNTATIYVYHRIGEDLHAETNIRTGQFKSHIEELTSGTYNVMALPDIIKTLKVGKTLPKDTIAITFDGGYRSAMIHAAEELDKHEIPYTVFISTDIADTDYSKNTYLVWKDIKKLARKDHVTIGLHPARYDRLFDLPETEIRTAVNKAISRYREELDATPTLFSYPFGEYSSTYKSVISSSGFDAALTQNSGTMHKDVDFFEIPRFTMTESYGNLARFVLTSHALPMPVYDIQPADPLIKEDKIPQIGFTLHKDLVEKAQKMACFMSGYGKLEHEFVTEKRIQIKTDVPQNSRRVRVNCTMSERSDTDADIVRWRWFGILLTHAGQASAEDAE